MLWLALSRRQGDLQDKFKIFHNILLNLLKGLELQSEPIFRKQKTLKSRYNTAHGVPSV